VSGHAQPALPVEVTGTSASPTTAPRRPRAWLAILAAGLLLLGPTVLAFYTGGYFDSARVAAGFAAWAMVAIAALLVPGGLPRSTSARVTLGAYALLAGWTLASTAWAPVAGDAYAAAQRVFLYLGVLLAAAMLLRHRVARRLVEPVLAGGILVVIGYGLSERLLPGLLQFQRSPGASGRLEQPLTYWNAMGELAALGVVLAARLAGDRSRPRWVRMIGVASTAPLGLGLYLTVSRGALFACAAGLLALVVAAPSVAQLRAVGLAIGAVVVSAAVGGQFSGVAKLTGTLSTREQQGLVVLAALVVIAVVTVLAGARLRRTESDRSLRLPRRSPVIALVVVCAGLAVAIAAGAHESTTQSLSSSASRLTTLQSDRYDYWRVAWRAFKVEPLHGVGAGGWAVYWLRYRPYNAGAMDAHSLPIQTLAELGVIGLALLLALVGAVAFAVRAAHRHQPALAAGPIAGVVAYIAHAPLDWDWEMPALTLVAMMLAGAILALSDGDGPPWRAAVATGQPA